MKLNNQTTNQIIQKFFDLFITAQYKYIIMNQEGEYRSYNSYKYEKHKPLSRWYIKSHLEGKHTLGIYAAQYVSSFICFDIDVPDKLNAKWTTYKLIDVLKDIGIPEQYIYVSSSGNKGYHVDIYFKDALFNEIIKDFYDLVISNIDFTHIKGDIELRPTRQGLKLPLGRNFKNKNQADNICWYVDSINLTPIEDYEYILNINQIESDIIKDILEQTHGVLLYKHSIDKQEANTVESTKGYLDSKYQSLSIYKKNIDTEITIEDAERIESEGLRMTGTRHNSLFSLCKYYKYLGQSEEENESSLIEWMNEQDTRLYTTEIKDCYEDIKKIVHYIYDRDVNIVQAKKEITITYGNILDVLKVKSRNEKMLLYAMIIHSKRYANDQGVFYMTYNQMVESTGLGLRTVKRLVNSLEKYDSLDIIERNRKVLDGNGRLLTKRPNKYKINFTDINKEEKVDEKLNSIIIDNESDIKLDEALLTFFDLPSLKKILPERHYRELSKVKL